MARDAQNEHTLSVRERDRRYSSIRERLRENGVDCAIVNGSNLFYLSNGIAGELYGLLPAGDVPLTVVVNRRHLIDISPSVLLDSQEWVSDVRPGSDAAAVVERIKELGLGQATIGLAGSLDYRFHNRLKASLSAAKVVDVSDIFTDVRTIKSAEENAMIDQANKIFDSAIRRIHEVARPGLSGRKIKHKGIGGMWQIGRALKSPLSFNLVLTSCMNQI